MTTPPPGAYGQSTGPWSPTDIYGYGTKVTFYGQTWMSQVAENVALRPGETYTSGAVTWPVAWMPVGPNKTWARPGDWDYNTTYLPGDSVKFSGSIWFANTGSTSVMPDGVTWVNTVLTAWSSASTYPKGAWVKYGSPALAYIAVEHSVPADTATPGVSPYWYNPLDDSGNPVFG